MVSVLCGIDAVCTRRQRVQSRVVERRQINLQLCGSSRQTVKNQEVGERKKRESDRARIDQVQHAHTQKAAGARGCWERMRQAKLLTGGTEWSWRWL